MSKKVLLAGVILASLAPAAAFAQSGSAAATGAVLPESGVTLHEVSVQYKVQGDR